jgi:hypothetical protein
LVSQPFSTIFLYFLIAKCRNISNRLFLFFYIVSPTTHPFVFPLRTEQPFCISHDITSRTRDGLTARTRGCPTHSSSPSARNNRSASALCSDRCSLADQDSFVELGPQANGWPPGLGTGAVPLAREASAVREPSWAKLRGHHTGKWTGRCSAAEQSGRRC